MRLEREMFERSLEGVEPGAKSKQDPAMHRSLAACAVLGLVVGGSSGGCTKTAVPHDATADPQPAADRWLSELGFLEGCWARDPQDDSILCWEPTRWTWDSIYMTVESPIVAARNNGDEVVFQTKQGCTWHKATGRTSDNQFALRPQSVYRVGLDAIVLEADRQREFPLHRIGARPPADVCSERVRDERDHGWDAFWALVERSRRESEPCDRDASAPECCEAQSHRLETRLRSLPETELVAFWSYLLQALNRTHTHDLHGALRITRGAAADELFIELRLSLVARGREAFEAALLDPDGSADTFASLPISGCRAFASSTPLASPGGVLPPSFDASGSPLLGTPWKQSDLAIRFPRLCKRFGGC